MRFLASALAATAAALFAAAPAAAADWAVIVAGSNGFDNYRHHADVCHSFHIAKDWGIPTSNIITMLFDDVANDPSNPFPGKLFNKPTAKGTAGVDVYAGCQKDYTGQNVTAANFLKVLTGDASAGGKVLKSTANDNVFINFVDHGATGLVAFPVGDYLYANDLIATLTKMNTQKMYKKLVFYMEACESGSMFDGLLPANLNIYATTASNPDESSWGTYCAPDDMVNGVEVGSCLGDLYSVNWMENSQSAGEQETLAKQFTVVQNLTTQSHVMQYGDETFTTMPIGDFQGNLGVASPKHRHHQKHAAAGAAAESVHVDSRDVELHNAYYRYVRAAKRSGEADAARQRLLNIIDARTKADEFAVSLVKAVVPANDVDTDRFFSTPSKHAVSSCTKCCKHAEKAVREYCGGFSDYAIQYMRTITNLCESGAQSHDGSSMIVRQIKQICTANKMKLGNQ